MIEQELLKTLLNTGVLGAVVFFGTKYAVKVVKQLYDDMKKQQADQAAASAKRENKLMDYLDKKNATDAKVADTLDNICNEIGCMSRRIEAIEQQSS